MSDPLQDLLARALKRASLVRQAELKKVLLRKQAKRNADARVISEDYTGRLQDRATFRRLLSDDPLDAARFRWYFERWKTCPQVPYQTPNGSIDDIRKWIDKEMSRAPSA